MADRPDPFALVFGALASERFPAITESLKRSGRDGTDRDAFLLDREVIELLRELVPEKHDPAQIGDFVATLHHAWQFWQGGRVVVALDRPRIGPLLAPVVPAFPSSPEAERPCYVQVPERLIWAQLTPEEAHEPLDGLFVTTPAEGTISALALFGVHPARPGFGVAEVRGTRPRSPARADGSPAFSPALPGGDAAGLHSIVSGDELLELAFRLRGAVR